LEGHTTNTTQKRLRILGDDEIQALYGRPRFTDDERLEYFALSPTEKAMLEQLHSIKSQIYFILQLGYFKAHHMFKASSSSFSAIAVAMPNNDTP
jgi:hypothetical protein